ncbi:MAG: threonine/serine dehydratase [Aestuariivirga sp.]
MVGASALPIFADIEAAAKRIEGFAVETPLLESRKLNAIVGGRILLKPECLQRTGSFKFRGAWNAVSKLKKSGAAKAIVAFSSGNHAQGVAAAAQIARLPAMIVMPSDAPAIKIANTRDYGAEVVTYDRVKESREEIAALIAKERHAAIVPPFDHPDVIAGQGTCGLELISKAKALGTDIDDIVVCCSGGGLTAGIALAAEALSPRTRVHTAEPEGFDDYARSLLSGKRERNAANAGSICDALLSPTPGELTFAINKPRLGPGYAVSDAEVREAIRFAFETLKLVVEPGGAVALAAVLTGKIPAKNRAIGVVLSGGNIDAALMAEILRG